MFLKSTIIILALIYMTNAFTCPGLLTQLSTSQGKLLQCITKNSVPVTMCISCKPLYDDVLISYDSLVQSCSSLYFDKDRINIVASTETMLTSLWSKAFCDDCFNNDNIGEFNSKNDSFYTCIYHFNNTACESCKATYLDLNNFYIHLDQHNNGEVCYDLQDSMNRTRNKWSKELRCCRREQNLTLFTITLGIISCLPFIFYGSTYLITKHQERNHGVLNDEDPVHNSEVPSSSRRHNTNDINNPIEPMVTNSSSSRVRNNVPTNILKPVHKNVFNSNEDLESSDDDLQISDAANSKKIINILI